MALLLMGARGKQGLLGLVCSAPAAACSGSLGFGRDTMHVLLSTSTSQSLLHIIPAAHMMRPA